MILTRRTVWSAPLLALVGAAGCIALSSDSLGEIDDAGTAGADADDGLPGSSVSASGGGQSSADDGAPSVSASGPGEDGSAGDDESGDDDDDDGGSGSTGGDDAASATDGEPTTSETSGGVVACEAPTMLVSCDANTADPFHAIGLGCPGGPDDSIALTSSSVDSPDANAWIVAPQLGTAIDPATQAPFFGPTEGDALLAISTGHVALDPQGHAYNTDVDDTANPDDKPLPAPMSPQPGSNGGLGGTPFVDCDGVDDCSDTLSGLGGGLNDMMTVQFETQVPQGTHAFTLDVALFSEEFPEWVGTTFNDAMVVWVSSESFTGNMLVSNGAPWTPTALWPVAVQNGNAALAGTGFETDGGTGWHRVRGRVEPLETMQVTIAIFEQGDTIMNTLALIDRFQWACDECPPGVAAPCVGATPL